ncbi:MAG: ParA family protein [Alphaproteobacteria bacterium]|nr:ParA family protein [Alphaproteobacteria bacterium]
MSYVPVIAFVSPKGGVGKTTASMTLASEFVYQFDDTITVIDADPNYPFKRLTNLGKLPEKLNVILDQSEETILDNIEKARKNSRAVIIDLEGTKNMRVTYAVSKADLVIIPVQGSILDANEAAEAIKLIRRTEKGFGRKIDYSILFTRMPAALVSRNFLDISQQFSDNMIPVLPTTLVEREAFKTMFSTGRALHDLKDSQVSGLEKAKVDSYALAEAVVERINQNRKNQAQAAA